jgi:hypothetical protein
MSKINKLLATLALLASFNVSANAWKMDTEGCFAATPIQFTDGSKGEYTLTTINDSYVLVMQGDEWNLPNFGRLTGNAVFSNRAIAPVEIYAVTSSRVMIRFPESSANRNAIIASRSVDITLVDGSSFMTFTLFGVDSVLPDIEKCAKEAAIQ